MYVWYALGMAYNYFGRIVPRNPWIGRVNEQPGPEPDLTGPEPTWWYEGYPCETYLSREQSTIDECEGWESFDGPCAACVADHDLKG